MGSEHIQNKLQFDDKKMALYIYMSSEIYDKLYGISCGRIKQSILRVCNADLVGINAFHALDIIGDFFTHSLFSTSPIVNAAYAFRAKIVPTFGSPI
jgi:hypothetical protein